MCWKAFLEEGVYHIECPCVGRLSLKRVFTVLSARVLGAFEGDIYRIECPFVGSLSLRPLWFPE